MRRESRTQEHRLSIVYLHIESIYLIWDVEHSYS